MPALHDTLKNICLRGFRPYAWLILVALALYAPTVQLGFVKYDDNVLISDHLPFLRDPTNLKTAFTRHYFATETPVGRYYRPLVTVSYMADTWLGNGRPAAYHATNVLLFIGVCLLLYLFLKLMQLSVSGETGDHPPAASWPPFLAALLYAVHPLQVMAVAWIPGRNDTLLACFFLPALWCFIRHRATRKPAALWGHLAFFALALLTKETAILIPLLALAWVAVIEGNRNWRTWLDQTPLLAWLAIGLVWFVLRVSALGVMSAGSPSEGASWLLQAGNLAGLGLRYYGKALMPVHLALVPDPIQTPALHGWIAVALTLAVFWRLTGRPRRLMAFGLCAAAATLALSIPFSDPAAIRNLGLLEHRMALPWAGILTAWLAAAHAAGPWSRARLWIGLAAATLALLACLTVQRLPAFVDMHGFWSTAIRESPLSSDAWHNFGCVQAEEERLDEAEQSFFRALELNPKRRSSHVNLAYIYTIRRQYVDAMDHCFLELKNEPYSIAASESLAVLYEKTGAPALAREWRERARKLKAGEFVAPWGRE